LTEPQREIPYVDPAAWSDELTQEGGTVVAHVAGKVSDRPADRHSIAA